jgi:hypothetical protein
MADQAVGQSFTLTALTVLLVRSIADRGNGPDGNGSGPTSAISVDASQVPDLLAPRLLAVAVASRSQCAGLSDSFAAAAAAQRFAWSHSCGRGEPAAF